MRLAFISTILDYPWGGADTLWTRAAEAAHARGDKLLLSVSRTVTGHPRVTALITGGAETVIRDQPAASPSLGARLQRKLGLARSAEDDVVAALQSFQPDLVIFSCGATYDLAYFPAWADWLLASRTPFRVIANWQMEQPVLPPAETERIIRVFAAAEALYFVSTRNLANTRRHLGQPLPQARVIHNPLRWQPADATAWPASPPWKLATVSRLDAGKGLSLFLQAAAQVLPRTDEWLINLHGIGPDETALKTETASLGLQSKVGFPGHVPDLRAIWGNHHLMVSASLEDGVPMTIPEALLCQRPVLATAVGGTEDWVRDGTTGFISATPTLDHFAAALRRAWNQRDQWRAMGQAGAADALARYRPDDYLQLINR